SLRWRCYKALAAPCLVAKWPLLCGSGNAKKALGRFVRRAFACAQAAVERAAGKQQTAGNQGQPQARAAAGCQMFHKRIAKVGDGEQGRQDGGIDLVAEESNQGGQQGQGKNGGDDQARCALIRGLRSPEQQSGQCAESTGDGGGAGKGGIFHAGVFLF